MAQSLASADASVELCATSFFLPACFPSGPRADSQRHSGILHSIRRTFTGLRHRGAAVRHARDSLPRAWHQAIISGTSHRALDTGCPSRILAHSTAPDETCIPRIPSQTLAPPGSSIRSTFQPHGFGVDARFHLRWLCGSGPHGPLCVGRPSNISPGFPAGKSSCAARSAQPSVLRRRCFQKVSTDGVSSPFIPSSSAPNHPWPVSVTGLPFEHAHGMPLDDSTPF